VRLRALRLGLPLVVTCLGLAPHLAPAGADPEETELRLLGAGVDPGTVARIQAAVSRGVGFLLASQESDGRFTERWKEEDSGSWPVRTTLLCTLALRHAGQPATAAPVQRALRWIFETGSSVGSSRRGSS
jgi:hypothetical protein